jgi:DNA-binding LacI/PurR family transcriptional regulator
VTENKKADKMGHTKPQNGRPTIGFLINHLSDSNCLSVWEGVTTAAREHGANVITFTAQDLDTTIGFDAQANVLYDMVNTDMLDGLVTWTVTLMNYAGPEGAKRVMDQYRSIPIVTIETGGPEDIPRVEIDSYGPMREMVTHLVKDHGYRRIAFIRGPDTTHTGARDRYQGYLDGLAEHGLPLDPDLVSPPTDGLWGYEVGERAISLFLDQRQVSPEAVAAVNDDIAAGAMGR